MNIMQRAPTFMGAHFDTCEASKIISQECSCLHLLPGQVPYGRLDKATSRGIIMQDVSGHETTWSHHCEDKCGDDIVGWRFKPTAATMLGMPEMADWVVLIIND